MGNVAFRKKVEENWENSFEVTNGVTTGYTNKKGFAVSLLPRYLTVDLEKIHEIKIIRFLLWDGLGNGDGIRNDKYKYKYRLLTSQDHKNWFVHFDTKKEGFNGWQEFIFNPPIKARYIRIHALWNYANKWFHIVQLEAYDDFPPPVSGETVLKEVILTTKDIEIGDDYPLADKLKSIADELEMFAEENNKKNLSEIANRLRLEFNDVISIEKNKYSIRREIIEPVNKEIRKSNIVMGIVAIISLILNVILFFCS